MRAYDERMDEGIFVRLLDDGVAFVSSVEVIDMIYFKIGAVIWFTLMMNFWAAESLSRHHYSEPMKNYIITHEAW